MDLDDDELEFTRKKLKKLDEKKIIEILEERIRIERCFRSEIEDDFDEFYERECYAIEGLLKLYKEQKEKYKVLSDAYDKRIFEILKLENKIEELEKKNEL